jgi:signal transduction histidine kinase
VVAAAEEERRRLRRDLHDGIGPLLTAAAARVDACRNLLTRDVPQVETLLDSVRCDLTDGLADLRRLVYTLRPPVLDELGLTEALRQICSRSTVPTALTMPDALPELPAAVEITVYRIVAEAVTNVVRHAGASRCTVQLTLTDRVTLDIADDGPPNGAWQTGVGLRSMRERTAELGGHWAAGPTGRGGNVHAELPLALFEVST